VFTARYGLKLYNSYYFLSAVNKARRICAAFAELFSRRRFLWSASRHASAWRRRIPPSTTSLGSHSTNHNCCVVATATRFIREIKIPCTVCIVLKLGIYVVLQNHNIPVTNFYVNSEFYSVTACLSFASCNCGCCG